MKNMVCLISDQHMPNLLTVHAVKPDFLVLIETDRMQKKNAAQNFLKALETGGLAFQVKNKHRIYHLLDENSISAAKNIFQSATSQYPDAQWIVNITGGTKPMSIAAYDFFRSQRDAVIYYVPLNNLNALNFTDGSSIKLNYKVTAKEFLAGYGFSFTEESEIKEGAVSEQWFNTSLYLVSNYNNQKVTNFLKNISRISRENNRQGRKNGLDILASDGLKWEDRDLLGHILTIFPTIKENGNLITGKLTAPEVCFLTGGWLEIFVWFLLSRHSDILGIWDVHLGYHIGTNGSNAMDEMNELDISLMQDQTLCIVECKTGEQKHDKEGNVLYKIEAVKRQFGAIKVKSCLATTSDNMIDKKTNKMKKQLEMRAAIYQCNIVLGDQLQKIANEYLENPDSPELGVLLAREFHLTPEVRS